MGPTHDDERESAARVDCDAPGLVEPGADAGAVAVASRAIESRAATSEGGDHPGGEVDTADAVAGRVLRCIMGNTDRTAKPMTRCGGGHAARLGCGVETVCRRGSTETSANVPLGSIATPRGKLNLALAPAPSPKPRTPLPASVVVTPVAISTRRMRWPR